jgi:hypothetical protein
MKRTIFIIVIIAIILYFQHPYINYINNTYEIIQYDNPNKSVFENMSSEKKLAIFTNIPVELEYESIDYSSFNEEFLNTLKQTKMKTLKSQILENFDYYKIPLVVKTNVNINYLTSGTKTPLTYQTNYRFLLTEIKNTCKLYLFAPDEYENLYYNKNYTQVDFWNQDLEKFPKLNDAKYIVVLLHKNTMINIPYKWIYCIETMDEECLNITYANESIFSSLLKK